MRDPLNAFTEHSHAALPGAATGPLKGLRFATKDVYDIAGHITGNGNPTWFATHAPAERTAPAVAALLAAGAEMVGKTHTDELAYSLNGENIHYGTPVNPRAPGRIPGGSSSGSAAAVAGGLVDFALGTDCGGSVRLPASYCGLYGIRTSHGLVSTDAIVPLARSFDTVGWFAQTAELMRRVGDVLLPLSMYRPKRFFIAADAFAMLDAGVREALEPWVRQLGASFGTVERVNAYTADAKEWPALFRVLQGDEIRAQHLTWIDRHQPTFGPGIRERFQWVRTIDPAEVSAAKPKREAVARHMDRLLGADAVLCIPTAPGIAPRLNTPTEELEAFRARAFAFLSIAGLARLPQVNIPGATIDGCPIGVSLIAPRNSDAGLLAWLSELKPGQN